MSTTVVHEASAASPLGMSPAAMIDKFIALRAKIDEIKKKQSVFLAPYHLALAQLEAGILGSLEQANVKSMRCDAGTAFVSVRISATVREWSKVLDYIRDQNAWELLDPRVSKTAAVAITEETGQPIPGVAITQERTLNVRRS